MLYCYIVHVVFFHLVLAGETTWTDVLQQTGEQCCSCLCLLVHQLASVRFVAECAKQHAILLSLVSFFLQVDAAEDMWGSAGAGRSAGGSKMLLEDADADEDDLVVGLGAAAGAAADFMAAGSDTGGATAMDAAS
jgi:hypothetical protein